MELGGGQERTVPEGQLEIAQHFSAGLVATHSPTSPGGTAGGDVQSSRWDSTIRNGSYPSPGSPGLGYCRAVPDGTTSRVAQTLKITVLAGGPGAEREVSLQGGQAVHAALRRLGHEAILRDIGPHELSALDEPADFVFVVLHGEFGEDGTLQAELEKRGIPFGGSGETSSRLAMDKVEAKRRCEQAGISTPNYEVVNLRNLPGLGDRFPLPAVVKPVSSGSSVDTTIARTPDGLVQAARAVAEKYGQALVERYISGPELTVGILGNVALPVCEIRTHREFYDYYAKYVDDDTEYLFDLDLPDALLERVRTLSLAAHRCLDCRVFSRVDWRIDAASLEPMFLEVNTIPGFTSHSLLPKAASRIGLNFDQLCQRIVELSWCSG